MRCSPPTLWWNIDVKSLESWASHLSWWYHKAAINSVTEHQTYHRHIIGSEDITESSCLKINRAFPGGRPLVDSQRHLQSPSTSLLGLPSLLLFFFSPRSFQDGFLFPFPSFHLFFYFSFFMVALRVCKYFGSLHNHKQRDHLLLACWLTLCLLFNGVLLCLSDVLVY